MSQRPDNRRKIAEVRWAGNASAVAWAGPRPLLHYWPVLAPYFRDVLLAPQRRSDEEVATWSWQEATGAREPTSADCAALRRRLASGRQALEDGLAEGGAAKGSASGRSLAEAGDAMNQWVAELMEKPDEEFAGYLCRTEQGWRVHSWSARTPGKPLNPDDARAKAAEAKSDPTESSAAEDAESGTAAPERKRRRKSLLWIAGAATGVGLIVLVLVLRSKPGESPAKRAKSAAREEAGAKAAKPAPSSPAVAAEKRRQAQPAGAGPPVGSTSETAPRKAAKSSIELEAERVAKLTAIERKLPAAPKNADGPPIVAGNAKAAPLPLVDSSGKSEPIEKTDTKTTAISEPAPTVDTATPTPSPVTTVPVVAPDEEVSSAQVVPGRIAARTERPHTSPETEDELPTPERLMRAGSRAAPAADSPATMHHASAGPVLRDIVVVHERPWHVQLLNDVIVPTVPRPARVKSSVASLREELLNDYRNRVPASLRAPVVWSGLSIESREPGRGGDWHWTGGVAAPRFRFDVKSRRAEIAWSEPPPAGAMWTLTDTAGNPVAQLRTAESGAITLAVTGDLQVRRWLEAEIAAADRSDAARFTWRRQASPALPVGWSVPATRAASTDPRLEWHAGRASETLALEDRVSGWALIYVIDQIAGGEKLAH